MPSENERLLKNANKRDKAFQRWVWIVAFVLILLAIGLSTAYSQTVTQDIVIRWTLPTTGCDNRTTPPTCGPLTAANAVTAINIWVDTNPIPDIVTDAPAVSVPATITNTLHRLRAELGTTLYVRAAALNANGAGPLGNQVTYAIVPRVVPGSLTITLELPAPP